MALINLRNAMMTGGPKPAYWGLCFTAEQANSTIAMQAVGSVPSVSLQTSIDGVNWTPFTVGSTTITLANVGDKVYFAAGEGGNTTFSSGIRVYHRFVMDGLVSASGSINSLLNAETETMALLANYTFYRLFYTCTSLTSAPELPATTLANNCYRQMFQECTSLTSAPELPATTLADYCYHSMFYGCTSLTSAPALPATTAGALAHVYYRMFYNCTGLERTGRIAIETATGSSALNQMFYGCSNLKYIELSGMTAWSTGMGDWVNGVAATGTFKCPSALGTNETITRGVNNCPAGWTVVNI